MSAGEIGNGTVVLSKVGQAVEQAWQEIAERFSYVALDEYVLMPNHLHGLLVFTEPNKATASGKATLGKVLRAFKSLSAIQANRLLDRAEQPFWQRNYYERIVRNELEMEQTRIYIRNNPLQWATDAENPMQDAPCICNVCLAKGGQQKEGSASRTPTPCSLCIYRKEGVAMAYRDFTLPALIRQFSLTIDETTDLFADVPETPLRPEFQARLGIMVPLALTNSTEKARSEFIIAPVLLELWLLKNREVGLLSGVEFNIDRAQGLEGVCDYIITRFPKQLFIKAPVLVVVEAKNEDMKKGYAQCGAELIAAQQFNEREGTTTERLYGVVTIGELWRFMELEGTTLRLDSRSYHIDRLPKIMGILLCLTGMYPSTESATQS